ncbi:MAG: hypothetical protein EXR77_18130 [Myxococcales bacterium]|nr:hypothetical protein [Myxococcales bacterium]
MSATTQSVIALCGGVDPAGQAGLAADLQACFDLHARGAPIVCGRTAQSDNSFATAWPTDPEELTQVLAAVTALGISAIKTGMLGSIANLQVVQRFSANQPIPLIVDPVANTTSGGWLWPADTPMQVRTALLSQLLPQATLVTPNWLELAWLVEMPAASDVNELQLQARRLPCAALIKGGHAPPPLQGRDWLWDGAQLHALPLRPPWPHVPRGTGCRLATAIAIGLSRQQSVRQACENAVVWLDAVVTDAYGV